MKVKERGLKRKMQEQEYGHRFPNAVMKSLSTCGYGLSQGAFYRPDQEIKSYSLIYL